jgi:hypothetical protein
VSPQAMKMEVRIILLFAIEGKVNVKNDLFFLKKAWIKRLFYLLLHWL